MTPQTESEIHLKGWGHEEWIVNNEMYCGKILHFLEGKRCSFHYHENKTETFYLHTGQIKILYSDKDDIALANELVLMAGQSFHVPVRLRHQIIALTDSDLFEFSTQHLEEDSYRIVRGD